jgi:molecular chaperone HtpG
MENTTQNETLSFQTEVKQLLHLMIHSLYTHKEIFLRELISNASDACDRLRFAALTDKDMLEDGAELEVRIEADKDGRTITVTDNGIGMSRDEVIENIGTIARSGTKQFLQAMSGDEAKDANLIGQFGVGFYSVFMVADKVVLETRKAGLSADHGIRWTSEGAGEYSIETIDRAKRGTSITLHLREGEDEYLDDLRLRTIIRKYSDHITLPVRLPVKQDDEEASWETVNEGTALWARPRQELNDEDYQAFYANLAYDPQPPLFWLHNRVEGKFEYVSLLYVPSRAPFDLWDREHRHGIKLYVRRVFIMDDTKYLMPAYLRFVRGVVDSADLPLNVSREFLQHNKEIDTIRNGSVKKILAELGRLADTDQEKYATFWKEFGRALKEGVIEDPDNRDTIAGLLRFATTHDDGTEQTVSLKDYIDRMAQTQKAIYFITAEGDAAARQSPHLEMFRKNGIEVLLLGDSIDEWLVSHLTEFDGKPLKSVAKGGLEPDEIAPSRPEAEKKKLDEDFADLLKAVKDALGESVKEVRLSDRLVDSPACLVADELGLSANLERILKAAGQDAPASPPILELNPNHPLIARLNASKEQIEDWAHVLFDQAALSEGGALAEPAAYVRRVNALLTRTMSGD